MLFEVSFTAPIQREGNKLLQYWFNDMEIEAKSPKEAEKKAIEYLEEYGIEPEDVEDVTGEYDKDLDDYEDMISETIDPEVDQVLKV
jgi:hypothetical protein